MSKMSKRLSCALAFLAALLLAVPAGAAPPYRAYAEGLVGGLKGAKLRPDLEAYLDALAASARRKEGRPPLVSSKLLKTAARAQAIEMLKGNFVGHSSAGGYSFKARFAAFGDPEVNGGYGENAARDRQPGDIDKAKAQRLFGQWLDSSAHRRNLMNRNYGLVSTGAVAVGNHLYAVQIFWEKCAPEVPAPADGSCEKRSAEGQQPQIGGMGIMTFGVDSIQ
ncbi:MAG: CAP domain-containing protein [Parvibaculaceae bacterium]